MTDASILARGRRRLRALPLAPAPMGPPTELVAARDAALVAQREARWALKLGRHEEYDRLLVLEREADAWWRSLLRDRAP